MMVFLALASGASAARAHHALPAKCAPSSRVLLADSQAQVYAVFEGSPKTLFIRGCAYGQQRSAFITACNYKESAASCAESSHIALVGTLVAYEYANVNSDKYPELEKKIDEWHIVVQNLRTGRALHRIPTGATLKPEPNYVGVGPIVGLVIKNDGSVAWIAEDYERSATPHGTGAPYFDVYAVDKAGTRLLASGANIDPSSLALSVGSFGASGVRRTVVGSTVYWTQGGQTMSAALN